MAQAGPASTKRNQQNATKLGVLEGCLGAKCMPNECLHWKILIINFKNNLCKKEQL